MAVFILMCVAIFLQLIIIMILLGMWLKRRRREDSEAVGITREEDARLHGDDYPRRRNSGRAHVDESGDFGEDAREILQLDRYSKR